MANIIVRHEGGEHSRAAREWWPQRTLLEPMRQLRDLFRWDPFSEMMPLGRKREAWFAPDFDVKETPDALVFAPTFPASTRRISTGR
jgi:hypothetical protein